MDGRFNKPTEPVCRFGPGGDFISVWPVESSQLSQSASNSLTKVLSSIAEIIATILGSEPHTGSVIIGDVRGCGGKELAEKGKKEYGLKNSGAESTAYTTSATIIKSDSFFSDEPKLFADDCRISIRDGHKQKHRVRAYRRTSKKRTTFSPPVQGSLFEADLKCTRTA